MQHIQNLLKEPQKKALSLALILAILIQPFMPLTAFASGPVVGDVFTFSSIGPASWTVPAGITSVTVKTWGAGGAAGDGEKINNTNRSGLGGGGGAYVEKTISVNPGDTYSITIGAGGQGIQDVLHGRLGNPGSESRFEGNGETLVAGGGTGGSTDTGGGNPVTPIGFGGVASGGSINQNGSDGGPYSVDYAGNPYASDGGSSPNGGNGGARGRCGRDGACPGSDPASPLAQDGGFPGGGGGGSDVASGGFGANGEVLITVAAVTPTAPADASPVGFFDSADCNALVGWAVDADTPATSLTVHVYKDGLAGTGTFVTSAVTNVLRTDVNGSQNATGNHGFSIPVPASLKDGAAHSLYIYAINSSGNPVGNSLLTNSPRTINCASGGGGGTVVPTPAPVFTTSLTANPTSLGAGQTSTLTWAATNANSCSAFGGWSGSKPVNGTAVVGPITADTLYSISCTGAGGTTNSSVTITYNSGSGVTPTPAPVFTTALTANPSTLGAGQTSTLTWATTNANSCSASGGWSGSKPVNGTAVVGPITATTTYTISCTGAGGATNSSATIAYIAAVTPVNGLSVSIAATPHTLSILQGGSARVSISSTASLATGSIANHGIEMRVNGGAWANAGAWPSAIPNVLQSTDSSFTALNLTQAGTYDFRAYSSTDGITYVYSPIDTVVASIGNGVNPGTPTNTLTVTIAATPHSLTIPQGGTANVSILSTASLAGATVLSNHGLEMRLNGGAWRNAGAWPNALANTIQATDASFTALNLSQAGTYDFRSYASNNGGASYTYSGIDTVVATAGPACTVNCGGGGVVTPAPVFTTALTANPTTLTTGQTATLTWAANNASSCVASGGWSGNQLASGSVTVGPITATTAYTITCSGAGGSTPSSTTITFSPTVVAPSVAVSLSVNANAISIPVGGTAAPVLTSTATVSGSGTLTQHGVEMSFNGGAFTNAGAWNSLVPNSARVTDASFTLLNLSQAGVYTFRTYASINGGATYSYSPVQTVTATAANISATAPVFTTSLQASPSTIAAGQTSTLTWATTNATSCTTSGGWSGSQPVNGSFAIGPIGATTAYTISCTGPGGTVNSSATITFNNGGGGASGNFVLSTTTGVTSENGSSVPVAVTLASAPLANVTLSVMSSNFNEGTTSVTSLVFSPANWNVPQNVIITGINDNVVDGTIPYTVSIGPSLSSDINYNALAAKTVSLVNLDNDTAPVVTPSSGGTVASGGGGGGGGGSSLVGSSAHSGPCVGNGCSTTTTTTSSSGSTVPNNVWILIDSQPQTAPSSPSVAAGPSAPRLVCPSVNYITKFLKIGANNDANEVQKLQSFLNTYEKANLSVNGIFDTATEAAVKAFQVKFTADILAPWGVTAPTGIVYITTSEKINRIYCADHPDYNGNVLDNNVLDNSNQFNGDIGQATTTTTNSNIAGVFGSFTGRIFDALKAIPIYQLLILLLLLLGMAFTVQGTLKKDIQSYEAYIAFMRGMSVLLIASVLNVLNTMSFMLNPLGAARIGLTLNWILFLDMANAIAFIIIMLAILIAIYGKMAKNKPQAPAVK